MASDGSGGPKSSLNVSIGKEIDAALGDVIRGLLKRPSEVVGDLIADSFGILGDRVKRKRELNAKLGIEEVRKRLDADGVDVKDITPPKEEELHLLMNGMSLADDETVRALWAGLFAKALKPESKTTAERPFISILESLSPLDAKVVDLLAFIQKTEAELRAKAERFAPKDVMNVTLQEKEIAREVLKNNAEQQKLAVSSILQKAKEYGLAENIVPNWADNLMRQGVIERTPVHQFARPYTFARTIRDERDVAKSIGEVHAALLAMQEVSNRQASSPKHLFSRNPFEHQLNLEVQFTAFGRRFAFACGLI